MKSIRVGLVAASLSAVAVLAINQSVGATVAGNGAQPCARTTMTTLPGAVSSDVSSADPTGRFQIGTDRTTDDQSRDVLWRDGNPTDLQLPSGHQPVDVNENGDLTGSFDEGGVRRGWRRHNGRIAELPLPTLGRTEQVRRINVRGEVAGEVAYRDDGWDRRGAVWAADNTIRVLPRPDGFNETTVTGIDDDGTVVGSVSRWDIEAATLLAQRAIAWLPDGNWRFLPVANPDRFSQADAIRHGVVVGEDDGASVAWNLASGAAGTPVEGTGPILDINTHGSILAGSHLDLHLVQTGRGIRTLPTDDPKASGGSAVTVTDTEEVYGTNWTEGGPMAIRWNCNQS